MIETIIPDWPAPAGVHAAFSLRHHGASEGPYSSANMAAHVGDELPRVEENRRRLRAELDLPGEPVWLNQVHGTVVADLDADERPLSADGALTRNAGVVCAVLTADCLPVLLCDRSGSCIAAVHAGWRGLAAGVLDAAVGAFACDAAELLAWLGPAISAARFEVGEEVYEAFCSVDSIANAAFAPSGPGKFLADLPLLGRQRLLRLGVTGIFGDASCTDLDSQRFFSYRRDGKTGRHAALIWRETGPNRG